MSVFKTLVKLAMLLAVGAIIAGVVMMIKRTKASEPVSYEQWPDVPRNSAA